MSSFHCDLLPTLLSGTSARVRYTCASVSRTHIAFGANSGSFFVYALNNNGSAGAAGALVRLGSFAELKAQALDKLLWLSDELLALASRRLLLVVDLSLRDAAAKPRIVARVSRADDAGTVSDWCVSSPLDDDPILFVGDAKGRLVAHTLRKRGLAGVLKSEVLAELGAPIVQLDYSAADGLLVSTTAACLVVKSDAAGVVHQTPVGTKARDGQYGAAFHRDGGVLFAARPGKRLWRAAAATGSVEATFNFAPSLTDLPEQPLLPDAVRASLAFPPRTQPIVFSRVLPIPMYNNNLLFACESDAVFLIDLASGAVAQWSQDLREILDVGLRVAVVPGEAAGELRYAVELYVLHACPTPGTNAVSCLSITPPPAERPTVATSLTFIDSAGTEQPASSIAAVASATQSAAPIDAPEPEMASSSEASVNEPTAADADDGEAVVKKVRRRKTTTQVSRRHVEIESGGAAFVPAAPTQRAVVASGESARIDRATLDAVLGRTNSTPSATAAAAAVAASATPAAETSSSESPAPVDAPAAEAPQSDAAALDKQKSFSKMLTGNLQKMTLTTKEKLVHATRHADDLIKTGSMSLARKLDERVGEAIVTAAAVAAPLSTPRSAPAAEEPTPAAAAPVSPAVTLQQALRSAVPPSVRASEMPFDALSVDRRDECSLSLELCGLRWRRTGKSAVARLREWCAQSVLTPSELGGASRATVAELLSACFWTAAYEPSADAPAFVRAALATQCLDVDDALRCASMRGLDDCTQLLLAADADRVPPHDGLELVRAGCRTRDLLRTLPTLLAEQATADAQREALELCVANFPVVQARHVARWLGVGDDGVARDENAAVLYLLYARILLETHTAMRHDAPFVLAMLRVLLRDGAPPRADVLADDGRFRRGAFAVPWRHQRTLLALLALPQSAGERPLFAVDRAQALALCREVGFYAGVLALLPVGEALQVALDAGDEESLARLAATCDDVGVWRQLLLNNAHAPDAAALAIVSLRSSDALEVVLASENGSVSEQSTRQLLAVREREQRRAAVVRELMAQLVQQVWRRTDANVAPQLRTVLTAEQAVVSALAGGAVSAADANSIRQHLQTLFVRTRDSYDVAFDYATSLPRTLEESAHHWGKAMTKADVVGAACSLCGLSLTTDPRANPLVVGGTSSATAAVAVVAFAACSHVQHQHCAQLWTAEAQTLLSPVACIDCCRERPRPIVP